jgi:photosystem II stability/assembly factor-like uncharacterized protein
MATRTKKQRRAQKRQELELARAEAQRQAIQRRRAMAAAAATILLALGAGIVYVATRGNETTREAAQTPAALPDTPDYHSLLVAPRDPNSLALGTHNGLYQSSDGGRTWEATALAGQDAMNLGHAEGGTTWTAGHNVLAKSTDGGETWQDVRPEGLPHLDIHGFAVDPRNGRTLWAALAGQGLYRSTNGGASFQLVTREVGGGVMALAVTPAGRILAGDMQQGLFISDDGGKSWTPTLQAGLMGLAVNPKEPERIVATGPGILLSTDAGRTWDEVLPLGQGAGPVAWAPSRPRVGYAVGFDKTLYKTEDRGATWRPVV